MAILLISFFRVRKFFLRFHPDKFEEQKIALWVYFVFDFICYVIEISITLVFMFKINDDFDLYVDYIIITIFPFIQAFGICFFKASADPLSNVSTLSYLKLVSINQQPTDSYWASMIKTMGKNAQESHKKCIIDEYLRKESTLSLSRASSYNVEKRREQLWESFNSSLSSSLVSSSSIVAELHEPKSNGVGSLNN